MEKAGSKPNSLKSEWASSLKNKA